MLSKTGFGISGFLDEDMEGVLMLDGRMPVNPVNEHRSFIVEVRTSNEASRLSRQ
jgi:hypothetical protein